MGMRTPEELVTELRKISRDIALWDEAVILEDMDSQDGLRLKIVTQGLFYAGQQVDNAIAELETVQGEADFEVSHRIS